MLIIEIAIYLVGVVMGFIFCKILNSDVDGIIHIDRTNPEHDKYKWEFSTEIHEFRNRKHVRFKINPNAIIREENFDYDDIK